MLEAIKELIENAPKLIHNRDELSAFKRELSKKYKISSLANAVIIKEYKRLLSLNKIEANFDLELLLRKRSIRTLSGIAPVAVLTKSYPCPGNCAYCPRQKDVPVSYLSNEPAVMRAIRCDYHPYTQVSSRLRALEDNGHRPEKIEVIVIGGTWSYLPTKYKYWYILNCFKAANEYKAKGGLRKSPYKQNLKLAELKELLLKEQKKNESSSYRIIGLTLETRPDYINNKEVEEMRALGCTRVEIGVQALSDEILKLNKRGHGVKEVAEATALLKKYGFKITYHLMPALPGASPKKDLQMFKQLFTDERFQPDQIKFYPTVVTEGSLLYKWYKQGKYKPYSDKVLQNLIAQCKAVVPEYVRIIRLIRDIPAESIVAGNKITNLRQILQQRGIKCSCIRCREAKELTMTKYKINIISYEASGGLEYFISADSLDHKILYGFCRLRLDKNSPISPAIIRELHVYGELMPVGSGSKVQHRGLGKELMNKAEQIVKQEKAEKLAIISGVGVRGYYRKIGYKLANTYMIKKMVYNK
ncbi:MAG: tRNA uridine(34) 5-carboxymethylaminomethyl modification radical SAM/GNAT enzyme Elp3 [Patescibacteria group bacterium]|nr:tRNA uridine(34) 5-carboxymethylaminomethyl modification radical SAM/GNAT enzyme Elp3 [Patescibacteria group bacterium]